MKEKRFDVVIVEIKTRKIVSTIGKNLNEAQAEKREITGLGKIDSDNYYVDIIKKRG